MDIKKLLMSGIKATIITLLGILAATLAGSLALALNYKPDGALPEVIFTYVVVPILAGAIGLLNNWLKHKDDK